MRRFAFRAFSEAGGVSRGASNCSRRSLRWRWLALLAISILTPFVAKAQIGATATIQGTVTDPTGAVIPGASVAVTDVGTGAVIKQNTNKDGFYSISPLNVGNYSLTVTASGFKKLVRKNIHLNGMQVLGLDLKLTIGQATETVTVSTAPPPLETQNATLGAVLQSSVYQELPLEMGAANSPDQQRVTDFAALMPGVSSNETKNNETDEPMVVNGNAHATAMYIEGIPFSFPGSPGDPRYIWPAFGVGSVNQFQLKTTAYSAEYSGLGVENFTVKSGSNQIHGEAYVIDRNTAFDAYGFLPPTSSVTGAIYKPPLHMNQYGISAGLPLIHNKLFFFGAFDGFRYSTVTPAVYNTIPTAQMFKGDFSQLLSLPTPVKIYDPTTETCTSTSCTRQPFPGNIIPPGEISPIAQKMAQFWQGISYANSDLTKNFLGSYAYGLSNWDGNIHVDANLSSKQTVSVLLATGRQGLVGPSAQSTDVGPFPYRYSKYYRPVTRVGIFEDTYILSSTLVNQFKYGTAQYHSPDFNPTYPINAWAAATFGIQGLPNGQAAGGFPAEKFSGAYAPAQWGTQNGTQDNADDFNLVDNLQWVRGKHSLSFGFDIQWLDNNVISAMGGSTPATLQYSGTETANFLQGSTTIDNTTGVPFASYILGAVDQGSYTVYAPIAQEQAVRNRDWAWYVNDDYRASSKLTVNAGLRWDYMPPFHEAHQAWSFLNTTAVNPVTGTPGTLEFAGNGVDSCHCTTPVKGYNGQFGPRLGLAYELDSKTVFRASYGMYYTIGGGTSGSTASNLGFSSAPSAVSPAFGLPAFYLNGNSSFAGASTVQGYSNDPTSTTFGGTGFSATQPPIYNAAYGTFYASNAVAPYKLSTTMTYADPYYGGRSPEFEGWSFGFQRLLTPNITATVSYVGNEAHFLPFTSGGARGIYSNGLNPIYLSMGSTLNQKATSTNMPSGQGLPYPTFNNTVAQALTPFPQFKGVSDAWGDVANSNYNALQLSIVQRASRGLTFMLNYTYSKNIDDDGTYRSGYALPAGTVEGTSQSFALDRIDRSLSTIDMPQNLVFTSVYNLPFGKGHSWGGSNPILNQIVSGWTLSDIFTYVSGNPLAITSSSCDTPGQGTCMPAYTPGFTGSARQNGAWGHGATRETLAKIQYINPNAFAATSDQKVFSNPYLIGNAARTAPYGLRGPSNYDIDGSLRRTFNLLPSEHVQLVFEADVFNAVNHVWFGSTSSNASGSIGQEIEGTPAESIKLGVVNGQANEPRQWQFSGHVNF